MSELLNLLCGLARQRDDKSEQIRQVVAEAREAGATWQKIAACLGVSRLAAAQMYGTKAGQR